MKYDPRASFGQVFIRKEGGPIHPDDTVGRTYDDQSEYDAACNAYWDYLEIDKQLYVFGECTVEGEGFVRPEVEK